MWGCFPFELLMFALEPDGFILRDRNYHVFSMKTFPAAHALLYSLYLKKSVSFLSHTRSFQTIVSFSFDLHFPLIPYKNNFIQVSMYLAPNTNSGHSPDRNGNVVF